MVSDLIIIVVVVRILWLLPAISTSSHTGECVYKWSSKWKNSPSKLLKLNSKKRLYQWLMQSVFMKIHKKSMRHIKLVSLIKNHGSIIEKKQRSTRSLSLSSSPILVVSMIDMNKDEPEAATTIPSTRSFLLSASTAPCGKIAFDLSLVFLFWW